MFRFFICALAGIGAGVATGFAGLSAAVFITPMLVTFLNIPVFEAVGIALASDVLASAVTAFTYYKSGNIDTGRSSTLLVSVVTFTVIGSIVAFAVSSFAVGEHFMELISITGSLVLGLKFILNPITRRAREKTVKRISPALLSALCGAVIGFVCGFQGTGGGMMMLFALTIVLGYAFKTAVGTSVLIMTFTAFIGAGVHFAINGFPNLEALLVCVTFTFLAARVSAQVANRITVKNLNRTTGVLLAVSAFVMLLTNLFIT